MTRSSTRSPAPARPRKRFGQHFLVDEDVIGNIAAAAAGVPAAADGGHADGELVVEIGPGEGALTAALLRRGVDLTVIELDRDLAGTLPARLLGAGVPAERVASMPVIQADAMRTDFAALAGGRALRVVGNLPYNISTPLLFHLLAQSDAVREMVFMLQAEVVARLTAAPGSKQWGRLGVMTQLLAETEALFDVPPTAFRPPPKVWSSVVRIAPRADQPDAATRAAVDAVVTRAFSQRRKTLRNALREMVSPQAMLDAGIDPGRRPETLSLKDFISLSDVNS